MARIKAEVAELASARHAPRTLSAYASDWVSFSDWCRKHRLSSLPASPDTVAAYLVDQLASKRVSTVERRLAAIVYHHSVANHPSPSTSLVKGVLRGARRKHDSAPRKKSALTVEELRQVVATFDLDSARGSRDRAMIVLGFAGGFRRSELAGLKLSDVVLRKTAIDVHVRKSKADQFGRGRHVVLPMANSEELCPVRSVKHWLDEYRGDVGGPLFLGVTKGGIVRGGGVDSHVVYYALLLAAKRAGLDPKRFGAHSLRSGFCTASADAGADVFDIMAVTGHSSVETLAGYVRRSEQRYPLRAVI